MDLKTQTTTARNADRATPTPTLIKIVLWLLRPVFLSCINIFSFAFMTYSVSRAVFIDRESPGAVTFAAGSYVLLILLSICMWALEKTPDKESPKRELLKAAMWTIAMALDVLFSYRVTVLLDSSVMSVIVWTIAGLTCTLGSYFLFFYPLPADTAASRAPATSAAPTKGTDP